MFQSVQKIVLMQQQYGQLMYIYEYEATPFRSWRNTF